MDEKALESLREALDSKVMDRFEVGTVIRWKSADRYNYAAIKAGNGLWYITGTGVWYGKTSFSYEELLENLGRAEVSEVAVATAWAEIA